MISNIIKLYKLVCIKERRGTTLSGIHFLLTYMCNLECDHCFVYSGPKAKGTFTISQIQNVLDEATKIESIECPYEDLKNPKRVHLDSYGNVHICQGLSMGNIWEIPLAKLVKSYNADSHTICGPLVRGGPACLAKEYNVDHEDKYVDACHFCYLVRLSLIDRFPQYLAPKQVYGLE